MRATGKARAAKAMKCTSLLLSLAAGGDASSGQSIAMIYGRHDYGEGDFELSSIPSVYLCSTHDASLCIYIGYFLKIQNL